MNRLAGELSPYLLQHAANPVDWYPWGEEAFAAARASDKPIFLSVGYSTCHWCHVMAHESFEDPATASVLNELFVPIKVDREERPDVDRVYMAFVQATTGGGGWPLSVWLTPDLRPFYGGTYFPPTPRWNRPGFVEVLQGIGRAWRDDRARVLASAEAVMAHLRAGQHGTRATLPGDAALGLTVDQFRDAFDLREGGFGGAPKFPRPSELLFLLREYKRTGAEEARGMAVQTLAAMALGGMRDHIGGGFHRYSVDAEWRVPHFEKMLYDQAQLVLAYLEAAQASGDWFFAGVAEDTLRYVGRDLASPEGGFFSAEDADSVPPDKVGAPNVHPVEGAFYLWRDDEVRQVLGEDADAFACRFGIERDGNVPADLQHECAGGNQLYVARTLDDVAREAGRTAAEIGAALERGRARLFAARAARPRPHLDDKVLTAWNGLMIAACARAARVFCGFAAGWERSGREHLEAARRAAGFIHDRMWNGRTLWRRYRRGEASIEGYAEDYAYLVAGLIELFQADPDPVWLDWAIKLQERQDELFWDEEAGGWYSTSGADRTVLLRMKDDYDGAEPAASSVSVMNLVMLTHLVARQGWQEKIGRTLELFGERLDQAGRTVPMMAAALSAYTAGVQQVVVVGDDADRRAFDHVVAERYAPFAVVLSVDPAAQQRLATRLPLVAAMRPAGGGAAAYVCRDFACQAPVTSPEELARQLGP